MDAIESYFLQLRKRKKKLNGMVRTKINNLPRKNKRIRTVCKALDCFSKERKIQKIKKPFPKLASARYKNDKNI